MILKKNIQPPPPLPQPMFPNNFESTPTLGFVTQHPQVNPMMQQAQLQPQFDYTIQPLSSMPSQPSYFEATSNPLYSSSLQHINPVLLQNLMNSPYFHLGDLFKPEPESRRKKSESVERSVKLSGSRRQQVDDEEDELDSEIVKKWHLLGERLRLRRDNSDPYPEYM